MLIGALVKLIFQSMTSSNNIYPKCSGPSRTLREVTHQNVAWTLLSWGHGVSETCPTRVGHTCRVYF